MTVAHSPQSETLHAMSFALRIAKTTPSATLPRRASMHAAGFDLFASDAERSYDLMPRQRLIVPTGIAIELAHGMVALVCARSGLAFKHGVCVVNGPGVVDSDYRGEIKVCLLNTGDDLVEIKPGDRIAQILFVRHEVADFVETDFDKLAPTDRGQGGFGSTGR